MTRVWEAALPGGDKFILLAIADSANDEGYCWPSVATLARKCSMTERGVQKALQRVDPYLERDMRPGTSTMYRLLADKLPTPEPEFTPELSSPPNSGSPHPRTPVHPNRKGTVIGKKASPSHQARALAKPDFPMPDYVDPQAWADFLTNRKRKRMANTPTAHKRMMDDLNRLTAKTGLTAGQLIEYAAARGWGGIYEPDTFNGGRNDAPADEPRNAALRAGLRAEAAFRAG